MKTAKEITKDQIEEVLDVQQYVTLFEKKSAKLFINVIPSSSKVNYSVINRKTFDEDTFDLLFDAANFYNQLP